MARRETLVQLTTEQVAALDDLARRRGMSRSKLIRDAVDALLSEDEERRLAEAIVDGYRRVPPGTPDAWGDLQRLADLSTVETLVRLDEEEGSEGVASW